MQKNSKYIKDLEYKKQLKEDIKEHLKHSHIIAFFFFSAKEHKS